MFPIVLLQRHQKIEPMKAALRSTSQMGEENVGNYKLYLTPSGSEGSIDVPRTTKWHHLQATGEHESCPQEDGESELVNAGIDLNAAGKNFYY